MVLSLEEVNQSILCPQNAFYCIPTHKSFFHTKQPGFGSGIKSLKNRRVLDCVVLSVGVSRELPQ